MNNPFEDEFEENRQHIRVMEIALTLACDKLAKLFPEAEYSSFGYWYEEAEKHFKLKKNGKNGTL